MASRVKLLNAVTGSATGTSFKNGTAKPPYTLTFRGGYTGTGVNIEFSDDNVNWVRGMGELGGLTPVEGPNSPQELTAIPSDAVAIVNAYTRWIRANAVAITGNATVVMEHTC